MRFARQVLIRYMGTIGQIATTRGASVGGSFVPQRVDDESLVETRLMAEEAARKGIAVDQQAGIASFAEAAALDRHVAAVAKQRTRRVGVVGEAMSVLPEDAVDVLALEVRQRQLVRVGQAIAHVRGAASAQGLDAFEDRGFFVDAR